MGHQLVYLADKKFMKQYSIAILFLIILFTACKKDKDDSLVSATICTPNVLLIIADDLGKDAIAGFSEGSVKPYTPNIDAIRNSGLSFTNCWVYPTCSPTRASLITGKYGYRTGVKWVGDELQSTETILHQRINTQTNNSYATAVIGKWHLAGDGNNSFNPESFGMDYYAGLLSGGVQSYYQWSLTEDGASATETSYITEKFTDMSIDWINAQDKPWFLWLAYTAPHLSFHAPPSEMHSQGDLPDYADGMDEIPYYMAAIEAMDYQIGRLLANIPEEERANTTILFVGDNGTPNEVAQSPYSFTRAKGSLYQGGINTPLFVAGPSVSRMGTDDNLICGTDIFATISEIVGAGGGEINDAKSFVPLLSSSTDHREFQYSEKKNDTDDLWTIRNSRFKLIVNANSEEEMYDLILDPYENNNLMNGSLNNQQSQAKESLEAELAEIRN